MTDYIHTNYRITSDTLALIPSYKFDSSAVAIEKDRRIYVKMKPLDIIKSGCLSGFSTYEGRRQAAVQITGFHKKVPIAIDPARNTYAFPTCSPESFDCHWLFFRHITNHTNSKDTRKKTIVTLAGHQQILVPCTANVIDNQLYRTSLCILRSTNYFPDNTSFN